MTRRAHRSPLATGLGWAAALLAIAIVAAVVIVVVVMPQRFQFRAPIEALTITITGPGYLDAEEVRAGLGVAPGTPLRKVDPQEICRRLEQTLPRVAQARWQGARFGRPVLEVIERAPVCMVVGASGMVLEVAQDGVLLPPRRGELADLPLLTWSVGLPADACTPGTLLDLAGGPDLMDLLVRLRTEHSSLWSDISEARLLTDGTYELVWNDQPTVVRGRGPVSAARLRAWSAVMSDLRSRNESDVVIDLRFRDQIIVSLPVPDGKTAGTRTQG
jgi:cell division protein FtsQ